MDIDLKFVLLGMMTAIVVMSIIYIIKRIFGNSYYLMDYTKTWVYDVDKKVMVSKDNIEKVRPIKIVSFADEIYLFDEWWKVERIEENNTVIPYQTNRFWLKTGENGIQKLRYEGNFGYNIEDGMKIVEA